MRGLQGKGEKYNKKCQARTQSVELQCRHHIHGHSGRLELCR